MKKITSILIGLILVSMAFVSAYAAPSTYNEVELQENFKIGSAETAYSPLMTTVTAITDFNKDGKTNAADAIYLFRHILRPDLYPLPTIEIPAVGEGLEIASITLNEDNHLIVSYSDGTTGDVGIATSDIIGKGKDGVGIKNIEINTDGHLIVTLSEGEPLDLGAVKGKDGIDGKDGKDGKDGASVIKTEINTDGHLIVTLSDGNPVDLGLVKGDKGDKGDTGVGISNIIDMPDGRLKIIMTDGKTYEIGVETGECETGKHKYIVTIVAPTCTEKGYTVSVCSECGKTVVSDIEDVTGHHYYEKHCVFCGEEEPYGVIEKNTDWYDSSKSTFELGTKEELAGLSYLVSNGNNFSGKTVYLKNDIDLSNLEWMPIGTSSTAFAGTFDGRFFKISNLKITEQTSYVGLFGNVTGTLKNFNINTANITVTGEGEKVAIVCGQYNKGLSDVNVTNGYISAPDSDCVGSVVGYMSFLTTTEFKNVSFSGSVIGRNYVGGLFGKLNARWDASGPTLTLAFLENKGKVTGTGNYVAGLFGELSQEDTWSSSRNAAVNATDLKNNGDISGVYYVGGFFGRFYTDGQSSIKNAVIKANITAEARTGAFAGDASNITINTATNEGSTVKATGYQLDGTNKNAYLGGYIGCSGGISVIDTTNYVTIDYTSEGRYVGGFFGSATGGYYTNIHNVKSVNGKNDYVGGIYGYGSFLSTQTYSNVTNTGTITGNNYVGGLFGQLYARWDAGGPVLTMTQLTNSGKVTGSGNYVGGLFGELSQEDTYSSSRNASVDARDLVNKASITGNAYVGCFIGSFYTDGRSSFKNCSNEGSTVSATGYKLDGVNKYAYLGGLFGNASNLTISDSINSAPINYQSEGSRVGGFIGSAGACALLNLTNKVNISSTSDYVGGIIGYTSFLSTETYKDLTNTGTITGNNYVGGLFGQLYARWDAGGPVLTLINLTNSGKVTGSGNYVGGFFGDLYQEDTYSSSRNASINAIDLTNTGDINGVYYVGGFFGRFYTDGQSSIKNAVIKANITAEARTGAFAGDASNITINTATNEGSTVKATGYQLDGTNKNAYLGGYIGCSAGITISDATNYVTIDYTSEGRYVGGFFGSATGGAYTNIHNVKPVSSKNDYVGGIYGYGSFLSTQTYSNVTNTGTITGNNYVGGLFGQLYARWDSGSPVLTMTQLTNSGKVTGSGNYVGGLFGELSQEDTYSSSRNASVNATDLTNTGAVSGKSYVGGLFGRFYTDGASKGSSLSSTGTVTGNEHTDTIFGEVSNCTVTE